MSIAEVQVPAENLHRDERMMRLTVSGPSETNRDADQPFHDADSLTGSAPKGKPARRLVPGELLAESKSTMREWTFGPAIPISRREI